MPARSTIAFAALFALLVPIVAHADSEHVVKRVAFKDGRAVVEGRVKGYQYIDYVFPAGAGESLTAKLTTDSTANYFNLMAPGENETAFFIGSTSGGEYKGAAPVSGDYTARVYLMRSAARRGETAKYRLAFTLGKTRATNEKGPDFADGLTGGPDFWAVSGVKAGDSLNLREDASPHAKIVARFANGTVLRNLGCKNAQGQRWCRVERAGADAQRGWVNGHYLRESAGPK